MLLSRLGVHPRDPLQKCHAPLALHCTEQPRLSADGLLLGWLAGEARTSLPGDTGVERRGGGTPVSYNSLQPERGAEFAANEAVQTATLRVDNVKYYVSLIELT
jgi:hypothetical protein